MSNKQNDIISQAKQESLDEKSLAAELGNHINDLSKPFAGMIDDFCGVCRKVNCSCDSDYENSIA